MQFLSGRKRKRKKITPQYNFDDDDIDKNYANKTVNNDDNDINSDEMHDEEDEGEEDENEVEFLSESKKETMNDIFPIDDQNVEIGVTLMSYVKNKSFENIHLLLTQREVNNIGINYADDDGVNLLMYACRNLDERITRLLLTQGADTNMLDNSGRSSIFYGIKSLKIVKMLVLNGCCRFERTNLSNEMDIKENGIKYMSDITGKTFLHVKDIPNEVINFIKNYKKTIFEALITQDIKLVQKYFDDGFLVNQKNNAGKSLIEILFSTKIKTRNVIEINKLLVKNGADTNSVLK